MRSSNYRRIIDPDRYALIDRHGRIGHVSAKSYNKLCVLGDHCFLCCQKLKKNNSNWEHVLPRWLLKYRGLLTRNIISHGNQRTPYSKCKIRCCKSCNAYLSKEFEHKISPIIKLQSKSEPGKFSSDEYVYIHQWLCLIQLKFFLFKAKERVPGRFDVKSGYLDLSMWEGVHHIGCIARSKFCGHTVDPDAVGSVLICHQAQDDDNVNIAIIEDPRALLLRVGSFAFISVPCDATYSAKLHKRFIRSIDFELTGMQLLELLCRYAAAAKSVEGKVLHETAPDGTISLSRPVAMKPPDDLRPMRRRYGKMLHAMLTDMNAYRAYPDIKPLDVLAGDYSFFPKRCVRCLPGHL